MTACLIGLGSNLGDRATQLREAVQELANVPGIEAGAVSSWYETAPIGGPPGQGNFLNAAMLVETSLSPSALLERMQQIERRLGRREHQKWEARTIDLDLLLFGQLTLETDVLEVPHPWLAIRRFVLLPAAEVAPDMVHPGIGWTINQLLGHLASTVPYVAMTGVPGVGKSQVIRAVLEQLAGQLVADRVADEPAAGQAFGSSGRALGREIQFLRERARLLDSRKWCPPPPLMVSDFWLRQSLAYGRLRLASAEFEQLREMWAEANRSVVGHRLVVYLEDAVHSDLAQESPHHLASRRLPRDELGEVDQWLRREVGQPGQGPTLRLPGHDWLRVAADVVAAIRAMEQPQSGGTAV
jgi:2-amino-4-hydroxy-6-hydroxymethyldihydropteridine diphosphokinase